MRRLLLVGAAAAGLGICARRARRRGCGGVSFEKRLERMPENSPRKWMLRNISAIRENTERILELLETERGSAADERLDSVA
jgi:hypothetical protein